MYIVRGRQVTCYIPGRPPFRPSRRQSAPPHPTPAHHWLASKVSVHHEG